MATVHGSCALCLAQGVELRESHILPSWAYKRARADDTASPDPVQLRFGTAVQTSKQLTDRLLCGQCEQRLGTAERYASTVAYKADFSTDFFSHVRRLPRTATPVPIVEPTTLDLAQLAYFGASVFWRAHTSTKTPGYSMGEWYAEAFRAYLLDPSSPPDRAAMILMYYEDSPGQGSKYGTTFVVPAQSKDGNYRVHRLLVCGLHFELVTGGVLPQSFRTLCLWRGSDTRIPIQNHEFLVEWFAKVLPPIRAKGKLARSTGS
jgi:hypothetical protein